MPEGLGWQEHFLINGAHPWRESVRVAAMAETLTQIARTGGDAFYRGALADASSVTQLHSAAPIAVKIRAARERLGHAARDPLSRRDRARDTAERQGIAALMALGMLDTFDLAALAPDSVASQHLQIEAMKLAFADVTTMSATRRR
jgi:gamma-glutamyltranspeptidase/glutathione hydrolase